MLFALQWLVRPWKVKVVNFDKIILRQCYFFIFWPVAPLLSKWKHRFECKGVEFLGLQGLTTSQKLVVLGALGILGAPGAPNTPFLGGLGALRAPGTPEP